MRELSESLLLKLVILTLLLAVALTCASSIAERVRVLMTTATTTSERVKVSL